MYRFLKALYFIFYTLECRYQVVKEVGKKVNKWKLTRDPEVAWDVYWTDGMVTVDMLYKMKPYQRINHFPGMYNLSRKSNMCMHLKVLRKAYPKQFQFYPITWVLPAEAGEFKEYYRKVIHIL